MLRSIALFSALSFGILAASPAFAGFEWVPPAETPEPAPAAMPAMAPSVPPGPSAQDMMGYPPQGWDMMQAAPDPYAQQQQMMQQQAMMAPAPQPQQAYYAPPLQPQTQPTQAAGYYAGAQAYANPVPPAPPPSAPATGLNINPYPLVQAGYAPSMMNTGSVEGAMMTESRTLNPVQLGNGLSSGGKHRPIAPSVPVPAPTMQQQPMGGFQPAMMPGNGLSAMPGGSLTPLPGAGMAAPAAYAPYAPPPVMQAPIAPPPPPVAAAPLAPPVMDSARADRDYPAGAPSSSLRTPSAPPASAMPASASMGGGEFEQAVGFGKDLPLALALSQVIPGDFALFFETAIDAETNVSWQGGKPWDQVLQEMLAPLGLRAVIQPNLVMIRSA